MGSQSWLVTEGSRAAVSVEFLAIQGVNMKGFALAFLLLLVIIVDAVDEEFTEEEIVALEELRAAGLLDANIEELLEEDSDYDYENYSDEIDGASERGGPRRRRRPSIQRIA